MKKPPKPRKRGTKESIKVDVRGKAARKLKSAARRLRLTGFKGAGMLVEHYALQSVDCTPEQSYYYRMVVIGDQLRKLAYSLKENELMRQAIKGAALAAHVETY